MLLHDSSSLNLAWIAVKSLGQVNDYGYSFGHSTGKHMPEGDLSHSSRQVTMIVRYFKISQILNISI
jgi:hypothetical protein